MDKTNKPTPDNHSKKTEESGDFVPLYALAKGGRKLFILSSTWNTDYMQSFIDKNRKIFFSSEKLIYVPSFVYKTLQVGIRKTADFLVHKKCLEIVDGVADINSLFIKISNMNLSKGDACFVTNDEAEAASLLKSAKEAKIFIQIFSLSPKGNLQKPSNRREQQKPRPKHSSDRQPKPNVKAKGNDRFQIKSTPELMKVLPIKTEACRTGTIVYDSSGNPVKLCAEQISHPNAITYSTDRTGISAKIFTADNVNTFLEKKVERMLSREIKYKGLCWPIDILKDSNGCFIGYLLPEAKGEPLHLSIFKRARLQQLFPAWTKKDLCDLALTILELIKYLHCRNILFGCINPAAIRIVDKKTVFFLDTDNYQIEGFPTLVRNLTFTPPELLGRKIYLCTKENDNYGVALLLFMLMMPGKLPYSQGNGSSPEEKIINSRFSFSFKDEHGSHAMPSAWRFMWSHLTPFKPLFYSTFKRGERYSNPDQRRSVEEWIGTLRYFMRELETPFDAESLKLYPETFKRRENDRTFRCSCCGVLHPEFYFYNPKSDSGKICNGCIDKMSDVCFTCKCCGKTYYYTNRTALFHRMKKESDSDWRDQKYCRDCKDKTLKCVDCGKDKPYYLLKEGRCPDCNQRRRNAIYTTRTCKDCGSSFTITAGEHESLSLKGFSDPVRCESCRKKRK